MDLEAEKKRFKQVIALIDQMHDIPFESEVGMQLRTDMKVCYTEIIRSIIVNKMNWPI